MIEESMRARSSLVSFVSAVLAASGCGAKLSPSVSSASPIEAGTSPIADDAMVTMAGAGGAGGTGTGQGGSNAPTGGGGAEMGGGPVLDAGALPAVDAGACDFPRRTLAPGSPIVDRKVLGTIGCAGITLGDVITQVYALHPDLADITTIYDKPIIDGSFIYAYAKSDGGFALVFRRGGGDCPSGCTETEYWYFETSATCVPVTQVGHYKPPVSGCIPAGEQPMWGRPAPPPESYCDGGVSIADISGSYALPACGKRSPCSTIGKDPLDPVTANLTMIVAQNKGDLRTGTVTFMGSNFLELDGSPITATFARRSITGQFSTSNLPANCPSQRNISLSYDFDRVGESVVRVYVVDTPDCAQQPANYCKGFLELLLGPPATR